MSHNTTLEALQGQPTSPRRMRPSELEIYAEDGDQVSVPLRQGKLSRRESRLGFRSLFGRSSKTTKEGDGTPTPKTSRSSSIRASIAEISNWPYGQQARSEITLPTASQPWESPQEASEPNQRSSASNSAGRRKPGAVSTWAMPPLFKAYPQAVRHGILPAPTISADTILRLSEKKNINADTAAPAEFGGDIQPSDIERLKRKLRGDSLVASSLQWTTKTYVLVTSGYLLQYSGEGNYDRPPEKVLRLGHSSAAFASDLIPGRHWVLQVSSATDGEGILPTESRSLFSKLQFRIPDKRTTSNLLMVFESAEDMKEWITVLRSEIEKLGGKKPLSETGTPMEDDEADLVLREQPSQRTIIVKDSGRFPQNRRVTSWEEDQEEEPRVSNCSTTVTDYDAGAQDASLDDVSTTNSIISHDGRQLDSLRDNSNRLSYLSSGQRTVMTSTNSSPAGSPVLERFPRQTDGQAFYKDGDSLPNRNMSLQAISPLAEEDCHETTSESRLATSACPSPARGDRASYAKVPSPESESLSPPALKEGLSLFPRPSLRKQLATIRTGRPLSTVQDQPSPREHMPERPITSHHAGSNRPSTPPDLPPLPRSRIMSVSHMPNRDITMAQNSGRRSSLMPAHMPANPAAQSSFRPRRLSSLGALRKHAEMLPATQMEETPARQPATHQVYTTSPRPVLPWSDITRRRRSSMDPTEANRTMTIGLSRAAKRASIGSTYSDRSSSGDVYGSTIMEIPPMLAPPPSKALPPIPQRPSTAGRPKLARKNSMPQLTEGPLRLHRRRKQAVQA
ncbi:hypothetical protein PT974_00872 [Cladobotryum mycophilum]|uniref:PH domain-containing protein n=1 Tax=Cladobotryum mycophilum TaxID=491253 RepID=A0ABR0T285_9HYPO